MNNRKSVRNQDSFNIDHNDENEGFVRDYLLNNNDFFGKNKDLLNKLNFPHTNIGPNKSLLERQNLNLKKKIEDYERKFATLIVTAEHNETIYLKFIRLIKDLVENKKNDVGARYFLDLLTKNFDVKYSSVLVLKSKRKKNKEVDEYELAKSHNLSSKIKNLKQGSFISLPSKEANFWLDFFLIDKGVLKLKEKVTELANGKKITGMTGSMAILPFDVFVEKNDVEGILIMISDDSKKFSNTKGSIFLQSIVEIFSTILISKFIK